ncbi:hypothetical protein MLD38_006784 [Melastoma candidum]|uniref:Uncharacterized protein n=1 Tax=Melastoma candidum TaxID=119954 RepID=A0ACB9RT73_9MYRT|nr:hypothetical protein MLD38_006784 [Melastoma candidum]
MAPQHDGSKLPATESPPSPAFAMSFTNIMASDTAAAAIVQNAQQKRNAQLPAANLLPKHQSTAIKPSPDTLDKPDAPGISGDHAFPGLLQLQHSSIGDSPQRHTRQQPTEAVTASLRSPPSTSTFPFTSASSTVASPLLLACLSPPTATPVRLSSLAPTEPEADPPSLQEPLDRTPPGSSVPSDRAFPGSNSPPLPSAPRASDGETTSSGGVQQSSSSMIINQPNNDDHSLAIPRLGSNRAGLPLELSTCSRSKSAKDVLSRGWTCFPTTVPPNLTTPDRCSLGSRAPRRLPTAATAPLVSYEPATVNASLDVPGFSDGDGPATPPLPGFLPLPHLQPRRSLYQPRQIAAFFGVPISAAAPRRLPSLHPPRRHPSSPRAHGGRTTPPRHQPCSDASYDGKPTSTARPRCPAPRRQQTPPGSTTAAMVGSSPGVPTPDGCRSLSLRRPRTRQLQIPLSSASPHPSATTSSRCSEPTTESQPSSDNVSSGNGFLPGDPPSDDDVVPCLRTPLQINHWATEPAPIDAPTAGHQPRLRSGFESSVARGLRIPQTLAAHPLL